MYCHGKIGPGKYIFGLYNITVEILRTLTIKLTQASAKTKARAMSRARGMVRSRARARTWECVLRLSARTVFAGGPNLP